MKKIQKKEFSNEDFLKLTDGVVNNLKISSIEDTSKFTRDSVILLYSLGINNFSLVSDTNNKIYLVKIENIYNDTINIDNEEIQKFVDQTNNMLRDNLYSSYDFLLNEKYDININANTLDRMKNYFK